MHFNDVTLNFAGEMLFGKKVPPSNLIYIIAAMYSVYLSSKRVTSYIFSNNNKQKKFWKITSL